MSGGPESWGAVPSVTSTAEGPRSWGAVAAEDSDAKNVPDWFRGRVQDAAASILGSGRAAADMNEGAVRWLFEKAGLPETAKAAGDITGLVYRTLLPGGHGPRAEDTTRKFNQLTGLQDANAPAAWGPYGKILDATVEGALGGVAGPGNMVRGAVSGAVGGGLSELAGEATKGTAWEMPARLLAGLGGGVAGAAGYNTGARSLQGAKNIAFADTRDVDRQAATILGRAVEDDRTTMPVLAQRHGEFLEGTPLAATAGPNVRGAVRGSATHLGPARDVMDEAAANWYEGANKRVGPVINEISPLPPAGVRAADLRQQGAQDAPPLYRAAGVPDVPITTMTSRPGAPVATPSAILGPDGQPMMTTRPGAPIVDVQTNSPMLQSPMLAQFLGESDYAKLAIRQAQRASSFKNVPPTSMTMIHEVYKNLGGLERAQYGPNGNPALGRTIGNERRLMLSFIEKENPTYAGALRAYGDPASLADAAELGAKIAKANFPDPQMVTRAYKALETDAHRREFMGGFAGELRGKARSKDQTTPAERFWNNDSTRDNLRALFGLEGREVTFEKINAALENERLAARNMRDITKGSITANKFAEMSDVVGDGKTGFFMSMLHKGVKGATIAKVLETIGAIGERATEGRTKAINQRVTQMGMATDPQEVARMQAQVEAARQQAASTHYQRQMAYPAGATGGLLQAGPNQPQQPPGPADRIMQGLLMGGL